MCDSNCDCGEGCTYQPSGPCQTSGGCTCSNNCACKSAAVRDISPLGKTGGFFYMQKMVVMAELYTRSIYRSDALAVGYWIFSRYICYYSPRKGTGDFYEMGMMAEVHAIHRRYVYQCDRRKTGEVSVKGWIWWLNYTQFHRRWTGTLSAFPRRKLVRSLKDRNDGWCAHSIQT